MFFFWFLRSFEVELAIKTDENDIFIVLCYYFKWYTVLLDVFCSPLLPRLVCGGTAIVFTVHNECDANILESLSSQKKISKPELKFPLPGLRIPSWQNERNTFPGNAFLAATFVLRYMLVIKWYIFRRHASILNIQRYTHIFLIKNCWPNILHLHLELPSS